MIRKVFLLSMVLYWSSTANALGLLDLCETAIFKFNNHQVNSFHLVKFYLTLEQVGSYLIDDELDLTE